MSVIQFPSERLQSARPRRGRRRAMPGVAKLGGSRPLVGIKAQTSTEDPVDALCDAFLSLQHRYEVRAFLIDLCTPTEIRALGDRWRIARLLHEGGRSYREVAAAVGASTATVVRVARYLRDMPFQGYRQVLRRL